MAVAERLVKAHCMEEKKGGLRMQKRMMENEIQTTVIPFYMSITGTTMR